MEVKSISKNVRITPSKVRDVARQIKGLPVLDAVDLLRFIPRKAARLLAKTLNSAIANAENNNSLNAKDLVIVAATANQGPVLKRFRPMAKGSAHPIRKSTCHITIVVGDNK